MEARQEMTFIVNQSKADLYEENRRFQEQAAIIELNKRKAERIEIELQKIPARFRGFSFDHYQAETAAQLFTKKICKRFVESFADRKKDCAGLILEGKPGTGKTFLSLIMCQELIKYGFSIKYESSTDFISNLITQRFKSESSYDSNIKQYQEVDFLVIDEISESINKGGMSSETEKQVLFQIINKRYESQLCTLAITNRNKQELINRLGLPIVDRLSHNGITLAFSWNSYRQ